MSKEPQQSPAVPSATLEKLLNLTARSIQLHAKTGVIVKAERGRYLIWDSVRGYVKYLQERSKLPSNEGDGEDSYEGQRKRLLRLRADKEQLIVSLMKGQSHKAEAVSYHMGKAVESCRAKILTIPNATASTLAGLSDPEACRKVLDEICRETAAALSDYDPAAVTGTTIALIADQENGEKPE